MTYYSTNEDITSSSIIIHVNDNNLAPDNSIGEEDANGPNLSSFRPRFVKQPRLELNDYGKHKVVEQTTVPAETLSFEELPRFQDDTAAQQREKRPLPDDWYIPIEFPYTYTHIDELKDWPQRLLHVKTMTSYEWTPGNVYGGYKEPSYRAVSYTWGRWRVEDTAGDMALEIHGVPWTIPRVKHAHFSPTQVTQVLRRVCSIVPAVDFVWLDIACIDQRRGPMAMREIGRQAQIFLRASNVAVWLSQIGRDNASIVRLTRRLGLLGRTASLLRTVRSSANEEAEGGETPRLRLRFDERAQTEVLEGVKEILCDPWFTGLWTLQEAFLARRAYFLLASTDLRVERPTTSASSSFPPMKVEDSLYTLEEFAESCRQVLRYSRDWKYFVSCDGLDAFLNELSMWVQVSGVNAMARNGNPLNLLTIARYRWASVEEDNVYGISQVFGYSLGNTRPDAQADEYFDREELELELGETLLKDRQLQSQLFVFTEPPNHGQGWRINGSCHVHHDFQALFDWNSPKERQPACLLSTRRVGAVTYGHFDGRLASFAEFNVAWNELEDEEPASSSASKPTRFRRFYPDVSLLFTDSPEYQSPIYIPEERDRHRAFGAYLQNKFSKNHLAVLYLGCLRNRHLGLLLLYVRAGEVLYWHRLGLLMWCLGDPRHSCPLAEEREVEDYKNTDETQYEVGGFERGGVLWHNRSGIYG